MCKLSNIDELIFETEFEYIRINPKNFQKLHRVVAIRFINEGLNADALIEEEEDVSGFDDFDSARDSLVEEFQNEGVFPFSDYFDNHKGMFLLPNKWEWKIRDSINKKITKLDETLRCYIPDCIVEKRDLEFVEKSKQTIEEISSENRQTSMYLLYFEDSAVDSHEDIEKYLSKVKKDTNWKALETFRYYFIFDFDCGHFCCCNISQHTAVQSENHFFKHIGLLKKGRSDIPNYNDLTKDIIIKEIQ